MSRRADLSPRPEPRCGWRPTQVVVEYNGHVLPRSDLVNAELQDGDRLEIIVPVAGG